MTLRETYEYGKEQLNIAGIPEFELDAWYLLEHVTGMNRTQYFLNSDVEVDESKLQLYREYISKRMLRIPLQHLTGVQEFMGLEFDVNEHVLIPRQDTEILVESVLEELKPGMDVLDMCTGSGCILLSLLHYGKGSQGVGVDISKEALAVAAQNAKKHNIVATFVESNLFDKVDGKYDVIVSNPPYIRTAVIEELQEEVRLHDPRLALDGMEDGLYFYDRIIEESPAFLKPQGKLYFEIGHDQGEAVKKRMEEAGFTSVTVKKDLAGLDRVVFGVYI